MVKYRFCKIFFGLLLILGGLQTTIQPAAARKLAIGFFVVDSDAYTCAQAIKLLDRPELEIKIFTKEDVNLPEIASFSKRLDLAIVDIMPPEPAGWLLHNIDTLPPTAKIYAVRRSRHGRDFFASRFIKDEKVQSYFKFASAANLKNMVLFLAHRDFQLTATYAEPNLPPVNGLYHPDAPKIFSSLPEYISWYKQSGHYQKNGLWDLSIIYPSFPVDTKKEPINALLRAYENNGINTVTLLRNVRSWEQALERLITQEPLRSGLGSITGLTFKFSSRLSSNCTKILEQANVPVFDPLYLFFSTKDEWEASEQGVTPAGIALQFSVPELTGLIEPTVIGLKEPIKSFPQGIKIYHFTPVQPLIEKLARRVANWHKLRRKANRDKKVVLLYYNHGGGKQNIGASYLNVMQSIKEIISSLKRAGYQIDGEPSAEKIKDLLLKSGRNIGSWAPNELDRLIRQGSVVEVSMSDYRGWLAKLAPDFVARVEKEWGQPSQSTIMRRGDNFIIPCITLGNLTLAVQPSRGWVDDPEKLYHSTTLYPHHQYVAFYLWLQNRLKPDAIISLGTHGTMEWLPGKQAGLSASCAPEVMIGDIPHLYPYVVDDVGEGILAKRRGRGVIIDHATPPFKKGGIYEEYIKLTALIGEYETAGSDKIKLAKLERIRTLSHELGLDKELALDTIDEADLQTIEHYVIDLKTEMIPYGLHTFGVSPTGEGLRETAQAIAAQGDQKVEHYQRLLSDCGPAEMESLKRGLKGGYIAPASGNDPLRNPESLPTGKNFYAFDPDKVPSKEAWASGKKAAEELIAAYREKHNGEFPEQIGVVLWAIETIRDQGINVATALQLMGMEPVWDRRDKVRGVKAQPGRLLGRPRIDVLLQMSGLFRDTFSNVALLLDQAIKEAAVLTDIKNFIKQHSERIELDLLGQGIAQQEAKKLSTIRLFCAQPGNYGTKVANMTGASGLWDSDQAVAEQGFIDVVSYGYSSDIWGQALPETYRQNLKEVDATVHSISSNLFGTMDTNDVFQYLGGLSMAVRKVSGKNPDVFISMQKTLGAGHIEPLTTTIGRELRSRYLNPRWIAGMKKEKYAGAREMSKFLENMWGWQVTTPQAVDNSEWKQAYEVYVEDKYGQDLKEFFNRENPWAYQSMTARMLEAARKGYWQADDKIKRRLAAEYALNVVEKGVACCDHTCNNPLLNQMVVNIISLPGVMTPEIVEKFKLAIEQAAQKPLEKQVEDRRELLKELTAAIKQPQPAPTRNKAKPVESKVTNDSLKEPIEGYKMEEIKSKDTSTKVSTSGVQWYGALFVMMLLLFFTLGMKKKK